MNVITKTDTKLCSHCKEKKPFSYFCKDKNRKDGLQLWCKFCIKKSIKENKERLFQEHKKFQLENPITVKTCTYCKKEKSISEFTKDNKSKDGLDNKCKTCAKQYNLDNKDRISLYHKQWYIKNIDKITVRSKSHNKEWYWEHRNQCLLQNKKWNSEHKEERKIQRKQRDLKNIEKRRKHDNNRLKTDINHKIKVYCRNRVRDAIKNNRKAAHTKELLMCTIPEVRAHLEKQWLPSMTWDNYGFGKKPYLIIQAIAFGIISDTDQIPR
jgi:hypothetical protein